MKTAPFLAMIIGVVSLCWIAAPAQAQMHKANPSYPGEQYVVTPEKLKQFHTTEQKVQQVKEKYRQELVKAGPNQAAMASAIQRGNAEITKVVSDSGMSMDEYNQLSKAAGKK